MFSRLEYPWGSRSRNSLTLVPQDGTCSIHLHFLTNLHKYTSSWDHTNNEEYSRSFFNFLQGVLTHKTCKHPIYLSPRRACLWKKGFIYLHLHSIYSRSTVPREEHRWAPTPPLEHRKVTVEHRTEQLNSIFIQPGHTETKYYANTKCY